MTTKGDGMPLRIVSTSRASDGSFIAISEVGALLADAPHRLIGGVAVVLHQHRLGIEHPVRATADADFGVPPYALKDDSLVEAVASIGYEKASGNRWERALPGERTATVDLLVPSYRTRLRQEVTHGSTNTVEVGGLAEALRRPGVRLEAEVALADGDVIDVDVLLPDLASLLGLKLHARRVRDVDRDAIDLWTCLELMAASGELPAFGDADFDSIRAQAAVDFTDDGPVMRVATAGVSADEASQRRTRIRGLARALASRS